MNNTSQQQAGLVPASQQDRFVKISLKLPPVGSGKIGFILQDDKQHYGLPLLMALSPDSPYHDVIPPHLVGHYWVIGVKDEVIGESKILNSKDLELELYSRRKKNEESLIDITFASKSGNANAVGLPSTNPNLPVMLPNDASQIPPQMMHPNQTTMIQPQQQIMEVVAQQQLQQAVQVVAQQQQIQQQNFQQQIMMQRIAARHQNRQLAIEVPPLLLPGQQYPAVGNQANNKPVLPLRTKRPPKMSPKINTKAIRDSTIQRALSEFFAEGETRPLQQFCQSYSKLYSAISGEVSSNTGLREIRDKRKTNEAFSKEDGRAAMHHINEMYSCDDHSKKRKNEHPDLLQRKKTHPLKPKDSCKELQSTASTRECDPTAAPLQNCQKQGTRQQQLAIVPCRGVYNGSFGAALSFAARTMLNTAHKLLQWAAQPDAGIQSFTNSSLATSRQMFLPYRVMTMERASTAQDGFVFYREGCKGDCSNGARRCDICSNAKRNSQKCVTRSHTPHAGRADPRTSIENIANDPIKAKIEIEALRAENKRLRRRLNENGKAVSREELKSAKTAEDIFMV